MGDVLLSDRPSFLCIITDQQRADHLGCAGNPVLRTPNIDRIAAQGLRFERAYVNNPLCMPARATFFTGRTARGHGVRTNGIPLDYATPTMTDALRQAGYRTHGVGKIHLRPFGTPSGRAIEELNPQEFPESRALWDSGRIQALPQPYYGLEKVEFAGGHGSWMWGDYLAWLRQQRPDGFDLLQPKAGTPTPNKAEQAWKSALPQELHHSCWVADRTIAFLKEAAEQPKPFFLWCSFPDPHHPYCPPAPWSEMYGPEGVPLPKRREGELDDLPPFLKEVYEKGMPLSGRFAATRMAEEQLREILALTYGMISLFDHHIGRILDALEETSLRRNTVVMFMSDHGDMMGDHWLINKGPFHFDGLLKVPFIWSWPGQFGSGATTDALASHLDFAPTVLDLAGVPIPEGPVPLKGEAAQMPPPWPGLSLVPILRGGEQPASRDAIVIENDEDYLGLRLRTLVTERYQLTVYSGQDYGELFDLQEDPDQVHNLWSSPRHRSVRDSLHQWLLHELLLTESALPRRLCHA
jgi:arylsulfatase A-like enzyme